MVYFTHINTPLWLIVAGNLIHNLSELSSPIVHLGLKEVLGEVDMCNLMIRTKVAEALDIVRATISHDTSQKVAVIEGMVLRPQQRNTLPMDESLLKVVHKYGDKILLKDSDRTPKTSRKKGKKGSLPGLVSKENRSEGFDDWQGPPPWDSTQGGDGCPKFLCDVMVYIFTSLLVSILLIILC